MMIINVKNINYLLLTLVFFANATKAQNPRKIRISPKLAYGGPVSEYFEKIEYIPLETTKESLFGDINSLDITNDSYVITDYDTKYVLFFRLNGKFIRKIKSPSGTFPQVTYNGFYDRVQISYQSVETGVIKKKKVCNIYGEETNAKEDQGKREIFLEPTYSIKFNNSHVNSLESLKDTTIYLVEVYKDNTLYNKLLPINPSKNPGFCYFGGNLNSNPKSYHIQNKSLLLSTPIDKSVYKIDKDKALKVFEISFPAGIEYPKDRLKITDHKVLDSLKKTSLSPNLIFNVENLILDKNKLVLKGESPMYVANMNTGDPNYIFNFICDTISGKVVALERLNPDPSSYYLPIFNQRGDLMTNGIKYYNETYYSHISSLDLFSAHNATKNKKPQYSPVLKEYFSTQNRKSNPVIVRMKLKE